MYLCALQMNYLYFIEIDETILVAATKLVFISAIGTEQKFTGSRTGIVK